MLRQRHPHERPQHLVEPLRFQRPLPVHVLGVQILQPALHGLDGRRLGGEAESFRDLVVGQATAAEFDRGQVVAWRRTMVDVPQTNEMVMRLG
jgi:hypothetical protein